MSSRMTTAGGRRTKPRLGSSILGCHSGTVGVGVDICARHALQSVRQHGWHMHPHAPAGCDLGNRRGLCCRKRDRGAHGRGSVSWGQVLSVADDGAIALWRLRAGSSDCRPDPPPRQSLERVAGRSAVNKNGAAEAVHERTPTIDPPASYIGRTMPSVSDVRSRWSEYRIGCA
jgi:hypothetical protein